MSFRRIYCEFIDFDSIYCNFPDFPDCSDEEDEENEEDLQVKSNTNRKKVEKKREKKTGQRTGELTHPTKRYIRDFQDPFEVYNDVEFKRRFRFSKNAVKIGILPKVQKALTKANNRGLPINPLIQLLMTLRFYTTANFKELGAADFTGIAQATMSRTITRVSALLASFLPDCIIMPPTEQAQAENRKLYEQLGRSMDGIGFPNIDGTIVCTHVKLVNSNFLKLQEAYKNQKGYYSLNVQTVVGPRMEFLDMVPQYSGCAPDSKIFQATRIHRRYAEDSLNGTLVGGNAYPSLPFLLTPIKNPATEAEERYNATHRRTHSIGEKALANWKQRFPCLSKGLSTKLLCTTSIVVACAVLHNWSLVFDAGLPEGGEHVIDECLPIEPAHWQPEDGYVLREELIQRLFLN